MKKELYRKDEIICPYCKYEFSDSWEYADSTFQQTVSCHECEKSFYLNVEYDVYYTTYGKKETESHE